MEFLNQIHGILRWVVLLLAIMAILRAYLGMKNKTEFETGDQKTGLFLMIACDIQLLIGLILYIAGAWGIKNIQNLGMGEVMKDSYARFFAVEHISMMLIAIILIHVGRSKAKKASNALASHKASFWFYLIGLIIMLASIPWPFRKGFEALGWM